MKQQSQDPFEAALMEQQTSPPEDDYDPDIPIPLSTFHGDTLPNSTVHFPQPPPLPPGDEDEEEENMDAQIGKLASGGSGDPDKREKMQAMLSDFTEDQMNRYESFRRSGFQKANMKRLLSSITGSNKISAPMTIVVSGIAKMFVGELVETARGVMSERRESGPIRPCHIREAYRRLKLDGKIPKRSVSRLFR